MAADPVARRAAAVPAPAVERWYRDAEVGGQVFNAPQAAIRRGHDGQWLLQCDSRQGVDLSDGYGLVVSTSTVRRGERELGTGSDVTGACICPDVQDQDHGVVKSALTRARRQAAGSLTREPSRRPTSG